MPTVSPRTRCLRKRDRRCAGCDAAHSTGPELRSPSSGSGPSHDRGADGPAPASTFAIPARVGMRRAARSSVRNASVRRRTTRCLRTDCAGRGVVERRQEPCGEDDKEESGSSAIPSESAAHPPPFALSSSRFARGSIVPTVPPPPLARAAPRACCEGLPPPCIPVHGSAAFGEADRRQVGAGRRMSDQRASRARSYGRQRLSPQRTFGHLPTWRACGRPRRRFESFGRRGRGLPATLIMRPLVMKLTVALPFATREARKGQK